MTSHRLTLFVAAGVAASGCATSPRRCADDPPIACNLHALSAGERARHAELGAKLKSAVVEKRDVAQGWRLKVDVSRAPLAEIGEWASLERRCCPFLRFEVVLEPGSGPVWLTLTGPEGTKAILADALAG